ncbi:hypothetical protein K439DRAFT_1320592, partial [Ramaria rubella]
EHLGLCKIAMHHGVNYSTLACHVNGNQSSIEFHMSCQKITPAKECVLVNAILESADQGFPPSCDKVAAMANRVLESRQGEEL